MSNGVKIIIAAGIYPPDIGGPATYSQLIAREFSKRGIEAGVICYSDKKKWTEDSNEKFRITRILRRRNKLVGYFLYFWNLLKIARSVDVIYAQGPLGAGLPAMWVSRILRKRFAIKIVGDYAWEQGVNQFGIKDLIEEFQNKKYNWKVELIRIIQKKVVNKAKKIIVPSEFLKKIVKGWGIDENKINVICNAGPDTKKIEKIEPDKELMSKGDVIISAGRLVPWKGMDELRDVFLDLSRDNPNFWLKIVGGETGKKGTLPITGKLRAESDKWEVTIRQPHEKLMAEFKASKIFVLNTGYEGFSHMILEAMACGLPVITTNVGGNPEIVQDSYNGLLVGYNNRKQLKEAILRLWNDKELQRKFIENGYKTLENFKLEKMIEDTLRVFEYNTVIKK